MPFVSLPLNAACLLDGLRRGPEAATPIHALCAIVDNAIDAGARNITLEIVPDRPVNRNRRNNVREYSIIDDGAGMDEAALQNALALGAADTYYAPGTLSKFGLGLKSASFSQGETLTVLSSPGDSAPFLRYTVRMAQLAALETGVYGAEREDLTPEDTELIAEFLPDGRGTIVRISDIHKDNHPAIRATVDELRLKIGVIYYYFLRDGDMTITVDGTPCEPFDVLFTKQADEHGGLNENDWNGRDVCWIQTPITLPIDRQNNVFGQVEATQLPHPPTFERNEPGGRDRVRKAFRISASNYGYYIYRNKRLISWAERFQLPDGPIIPQDQDMYAFRGRILLDASADEALNIDVKKSDIMLSDEAEKALRDFSDDYRRKSRDAWRHATQENKRVANLDIDGATNKLAREAAPLEEFPGNIEDDTEEAFARQQEREQEIFRKQEQRFDAEAREVAQDETPAISPDSEPEKLATIKQEVILGENAAPDSNVLYVRNTEDFALWEPYLDSVKRNCVRINRDHKFGRLLQRHAERHPEVRVLISLMLLQIAGAEVYVRKNYGGLKSDVVADVLKAFRDAASQNLAALATKSGDQIFNEGD